MNENEKMAETEKLFKAVEIAEEKFEEYFAELQDSSQKIFAELQDSLQKIFDCEHPDLTEKERRYLFFNYQTVPRQSDLYWKVHRRR